MQSCRNLRFAFGLSLIAIVNWLESARAVPPTQVVDDARSISKIEFRGDTVFSVEELRQALAGDPEFQFATHPTCPLDDFLGLIEHRLAAGYRQVGFPQPKVLAHQDTPQSQAVVEIEPGTQFHKGQLIVTGSTHIAENLLKDWILLPRPKDSAHPISPTVAGKTVTKWVNSSGDLSSPHSPLWKQGGIVSFHPPHVDYYRKEIQRFCSAQGYFGAKIEIELRQEKDATVTLVVAVTDEGPQATLGEIVIDGMKRKTAEDLIDFLELRPGMPITGTLHAELMSKLFESGKYLEHKVKFGNAVTSSVPLKIDVYENDYASPIKQPRSQTEEAACRLAGWLNQLSSFQEDLVIESRTEPEFRVIWSTRDQMLLAEYFPQSTQDGHRRSRMALLSDPNGFVVSELHRKEKLVVPRLEGQVIIQCICQTHRPNKEGLTTRMMFGTGMRSVQSEALPVAAVVLIPPAALIRVFCKEGAQVAIQNGRVVCTTDDFRLEMEYETGRLLEVTADLDDFGSIRISTNANLLQPAIEAYRHQVQGFTSVFEITRPCTSFMRFGLHLIDASKWTWEEDEDGGDQETKDVRPPMSAEEIATIERGLEVARKLLKPETLQPFDRYAESFLKPFFDPKSVNFRIPPENGRYYSIGLVEAQKFAAMLLSHNSWGYRITRDWNITFANWQRPEAKIIQAALVTDTESERLGPVGALYSLTIGSMMGSRPDGDLASAAIKHLSLENVKQEFDQLLSLDAPLSRTAESLLASVADCSLEEWADFVHVMFPEDSRPMMLEVGQMCRDKTENRLGTIPKLIDKFYPQIIEPALRSSLEQFQVKTHK